MEHTIYLEHGSVLVREAGDRVDIQFAVRDDKLGLYKAWIQGNGLPFALGTLMPEQGEMRLKRNLPRDRLIQQDCWPIQTAGVYVSHRFGEQAHPQWQQEPNPAQRFGQNPLFASLVAGEKGCMVCLGQKQGQWKLAVPFHVQKPFALTPIFCFCQVQKIGGKTYGVFLFDANEGPKLPTT